MGKVKGGVEKVYIVIKDVFLNYILRKLFLNKIGFLIIFCYLFWVLNFGMDVDVIF